MPFNNKVVWSEGMFLQPQHFQQQDRYFESLIAHRPNFTGLPNWGFTELEIDQHLLELGKIALIRARGILPDGTAFDIPSANYLPEPIDIPVGITNMLVYMVLPLKRAGIPEIAGESQVTSTIETSFFRYRSENIETVDTNFNSHISTNIQIAQMVLSLKLEQEERGGYSCLAIAKIKESLSNKQIKLDENFIPACLDVHVISKLSHFISELLSLLLHRSDTIAKQLTDIKNSTISEISDFMLLQLVNRYSPLFDYISKKKGIHPENFYTYLIQLAGELATFTNKNRQPSKVISYQHDDLQTTFDPIINELRIALSTVLDQGAIALNLESRKYGIWVAPIMDRTLLNSADFVLAVNADVPTEILRTQFISQTKIASIESIQALISRALPGITIEPLMVVPRQIPFNSGYIYFSLDKNHPQWKEIMTSAAIAIHIGNEFQNLKLQFWAIRGNG